MSKQQKLTPEQIKEIHHNFDFFDRDGNGQLDEDEFTELLKIIEPNAKKEEAIKGFAIVDVDGDGSIDFNEFLKWWGQCWWQF